MKLKHFGTGDTDAIILSKLNTIVDRLNGESVTLPKDFGRMKPHTIWELSGDDECWVITGKGEVMRYHANLNPFEKRRAIGNVFMTRKEAETELESRKQEMETRRAFNI